MTSTAPRRLPFFVYGTLREGGGNVHAWPEGAIARSRTAFLDGASMSAVEFPYVWRNDSGAVRGELKDIRPEAYEVTLQALDDLEGYAGPGEDNHYEREVVRVRFEDGTTAEAWVYLVDEAVGGAHPVVPSGDWHDHTAHPSGRADTASRLIAAPVDDVFAALVDPTALEAWLPPAGMTGRVERFEPRPGGVFRIVLTYDDPTGAPGKSTAESDVIEGRIVQIVPGHRLVWATDFVSDDPEVAGRMTMTWRVTLAEAGTLVEVRADDVPPGISAEDHATGMAASLANLAAFLGERAHE